MRIIFMIVLTVGIWMATPFGTSNAYLHSDLYMEVTVKAGEDVWSIARRHVSDKEDIRDLIDAVYKVNQLDRRVSIYPGQTLKIPVIRENKS